ncbi:MAG: hypothetical protein IT223_00755 [Crocinitomicaceae bacterium]|nr:hypothetical protein [Crocinitomicaceae bacterium]
MLDLPFYLPLIFILTTLVSLVFMVWIFITSKNETTRRQANLLSLLVLLWIIFQATLALNKWYMDRTVVPPHLLFPVIAAIPVILLLFLTSKGRRFIDGFSTEILTWLHIVRVPVEVCLFLLAIHKQVPFSMTFGGHNFDIVSGITAPIIAWWGIRKEKLSRKFILTWNCIALLIVIQAAVTGIGALPSPIQMWDFQQPNYAEMHFPFVWLPAFILPLLIFSHLVCIRRLWKQPEKTSF